MAQLSVAATTTSAAFNCPQCQTPHTQEELRRLLSAAARYQGWEDNGKKGKEPKKVECRECGIDLRQVLYS